MLRSGFKNFNLLSLRDQVQDQVRQLVLVGHPCIRALITAHAWALRASTPPNSNQMDGVCSLLA